MSSFDMPFSFIMIYFLINHMDTLSSTSCHLAITLLSSRTTCGSSWPVRLRPKPSVLAQVRCLSGFFHNPSICCKLRVQMVSSLQPEPSKQREELLKAAAGSRGATTCLAADLLPELFCSSQHLRPPRKTKTDTTFKSFRFNF